jgi:hypothetical protein
MVSRLYFKLKERCMKDKGNLSNINIQSTRKQLRMNHHLLFQSQPKPPISKKNPSFPILSSPKPKQTTMKSRKEKKKGRISITHPSGPGLNNTHHAVLRRKDTPHPTSLPVSSHFPPRIHTLVCPLFLRSFN